MGFIASAFGLFRPLLRECCCLGISSPALREGRLSIRRSPNFVFLSRPGTTSGQAASAIPRAAFDGESIPSEGTEQKLQASLPNSRGCPNPTPRPVTVGAAAVGGRKSASGQESFSRKSLAIGSRELNGRSVSTCHSCQSASPGLPLLPG